MSREELRKEYFEWLCEFVYDEKRMSRGLSYNNMFSFLFDTPFHWTMTMDENRAADGIDLRYRFGRERGVADRIPAAHARERIPLGKGLNDEQIFIFFCELGA